MISEASAWLAALGKSSMITEIPDHRAMIREYLVASGWKKQYTWLELVRWLDERARQNIDVQ